MMDSGGPSRPGPWVVAVVPALNEQLTVGATVAALLRAGAESVIVVDDGSTDSTGRSAADAGAAVVRREHTGGKGAAIADGLLLARARIRVRAPRAATDPGCVVFADADLGDSAEEIAKVIAPVADGLADMAVAGFPAAAGNGFGLAVGLARVGVRCLCRVNLKWPLSGQRAVRADVLFGLLDAGLRLERGFGFEVGLTVDWLRAGYSMVEAPTLMTHRVTGRTIGGFAHRGRQFAAVARALAARVWGVTPSP
jgi:glycosyltransferase involved in cell wall biosynthesis